MTADPSPDARPPGRRPWRADARTGAALGASALGGLWLGDVVALAAPASRGTSTPTQWWTGAGAALFVALTSALALGAILGPLTLPVARETGRALVSWWRGVRDGGAEGSRRLAAHALAAITLPAVWGLAAYRVTLVVGTAFGRPDTAAGALVACDFVFAGTLAFAWPWGVRGGRALVDLVGRSASGRGLVDRWWGVPGVALAGVLVGVAVGAWRYREELSALRGGRILELALLLPGPLAVRALARRPRPAIARAALVVTAAALAVSAVAALRLRPESTTAKTLAFDRTLSGRFGHDVWTLALDVDRDGQIGVLGGGDCAPFDATRHTGAVDVPGNGIDEDCDGVDAQPMAIRPRGRTAVPRSGLPSRPSIVLITVDAVGGPRLLALGSPVPLMPHVDQLAQSSMLFTHAFAQGPSTRMSLPSMFTSRWDSQLTFTYSARPPHSLASAERQIQDVLDDAGYDTVAVVPTAYLDRARWPSVTRGFQRVDDSALPAGKHNAPQVTDAALRVLAEPRDAPLYMWVHYYDAHWPYGPVPGATPLDPANDQAYYEAELRYADQEIGRLLAALLARPQPTYVIFASDHATVFHPAPETRHFHYGYDLYSATLHVPLIVHGPGIAPGRDDDLVSTMDIAPTIADLLELPEARDVARFEGTSLLPELLKHQRDPKRLLFHEYYLPEQTFHGDDPLSLVSVRDARYDLILNRALGSYELYDWRADYFEQHDLYEDLADRADVRRLRSLLGAFVEKFDRRQGGAVFAVGAQVDKNEP